MPSQTKKVERNCDVCGRMYLAYRYRLKRGWSVTCSISCANKIRTIPPRRKLSIKGYQKLDSRSSFKNLVRARAGFCCQICRKDPTQNGRQMDVHRIIPDGYGGQYTFENTMALCRSCHAIEDRRFRI